MNSGFSTSHIFKFLIVLCISFLPIFYRLGVVPIQLCDESRLAVNAIEMYLNNDFLITYFDGKSDFWNPKPPFLIWCMTLSMKIFGPSEFSFRLPVALAAFSTICILFFFSESVLKNIRIGFLSVLVLLTSCGYINFHAARSGDYDAVLTLWTTIYLLSFFKFLDYKEEKKKNLFLCLFTAGLILAAMTKGIAALLFMPGLLIYTVIKNQFFITLKNKNVYISALMFIGIIGGYYLLREKYDPGYLKAVNDLELEGRYLNDISGEKKPFLFYFQTLIDERFFPWIYLLPFSLILIIRKSAHSGILLFCLITTLSFLIVISFSKTIFSWYDVPVYPLFSIMVAIILSHLYTFAYAAVLRIYPKLSSHVFFALILILIFSYPYYSRLNAIYYPDLKLSKSLNLEYGPFIKTLALTNPEIKKFSVLNKDYAQLSGHYSAHLLFYMKTLNHQGYKIKAVDLRETLQPGEVIMTCDDFRNNNFNKLYELEIISKDDNCWLYKIRNKNPVTYLDILAFEMMTRIKTSKEWYEQIKLKAIANNQILENQLLGDALYMLTEMGEINAEEVQILKDRHEIKPLKQP